MQPLKKIHHLIRYFLFMGMVAFVGYVKEFFDPLFLFLVGPCIYMASTLRNWLDSLTAIPFTSMVNHYLILLPAVLLYFGFIGFQLKQLLNERGKIRIMILGIFVSFLGYIHVIAWQNLSAYLQPGI